MGGRGAPIGWEGGPRYNLKSSVMGEQYIAATKQNMSTTPVTGVTVVVQAKQNKFRPYDSRCALFCSCWSLQRKGRLWYAAKSVIPGDYDAAPTGQDAI